MPTTTIDYPASTFNVKELGLCKTVWLDLDVDFGNYINAYIVDAANLRKFKGRERFDHCGPGQVTKFRGLLRLPGFDRWHLVIENRTQGLVRLRLNYEPYEMD